MTTEIQPASESKIVEHHQQQLSTNKRVTQLVDNLELVEHAMKQIMKADVDYGEIPGTRGKKPSLYKPGAEILMRAFQLHHDLEILDQIEDWDVPFFRYKIKVILSDGAGAIIGTGIGEANSRESRYQRRFCPTCESGVWDNRRKQAEGKFTDRPAFTCKNRKCSWKGTDKPSDVPARFDFELVNTLIKMAGKRAKVEAVLTATAASHFFTQDVEDLEAESVATPATAPAQTSRGSQSPQNGSQGDTEDQKCPSCGSDVWDNRAGNKERRDNGDRAWPGFKCKNDECTATTGDGEVLGDGKAGEQWMVWSESFFDVAEPDEVIDGAGLDTDELTDVSEAIDAGDIAEGAVLAIARKVAKEAGVDPPTSLSAVADLPAGAQASIAQAVREKVGG